MPKIQSEGNTNKNFRKKEDNYIKIQLIKLKSWLFSHYKQRSSDRRQKSSKKSKISVWKTYLWQSAEIRKSSHIDWDRIARIYVHESCSAYGGKNYKNALN